MMCGVFGFVRYRPGAGLDASGDGPGDCRDAGHLPGPDVGPGELGDIYGRLALVCAVRGSDAGGIAYVDGKRVVVKKQAGGLAESQFSFPRETQALIGHCRRDLDGNWQDNRNNHPFRGQTRDGTGYALAHNGILSNLRELRASMDLGPASIRTDSYGAVSLIDRSERLNLASLAAACGKLCGSFLFTILDDSSNLYLCRGDVPVILVHFKKRRLFLYVSTRDLLEEGLLGTSLGEAYKSSNLELSTSPVSLIHVGKGEIVRVSSTGRTSRRRFRFNEDKAISHNWYRHDVELTNELKRQIKDLDND